MLAQHLELCKGLVSANYVAQGEQARNSRSKLITSLLTQRRLPDEGWDDSLIQLLLDELASFDSNNFQGNVGVGEREGRIVSDIVRRRHFGLTHGIGRSGDVMAEQPKAAGSSIIVQLTKYLALDAIHLSGIKAAKSCCVLPAATGMTMMMVYLALKQTRPSGRYVVWSRIDQKSCFKAIGAAGLIPIVVQLKPVEGTDALGTDVDGIRAAIERVGADQVLCIASTTSTFAPRVPDSVDEIAEMAKELDVPHVINNAYGLQCSKCSHLVESGCRRGRVDAFVQSTDKNFLVPIGGAIVAAPKSDLVDRVSAMYPGRASMSPVLDLFITLLSLGAAGWKDLLKQRKENAAWFQERFASVAEKHGMRLLHCPSNKISFVADLTALTVGRSADNLSFLGSALFTRRVSGPRVVLCTQASITASSTGTVGESSDNSTDVTDAKAVTGQFQKTIDGIVFQSYGAHADTYKCCYLTAACAIGATREELDIFLVRFEQAVNDYKGVSTNKNDDGGKNVLAARNIEKQKNERVAPPM